MLNIKSKRVRSRNAVASLSRLRENAVEIAVDSFRIMFLRNWVKAAVLLNMHELKCNESF